MNLRDRPEFSDDPLGKDQPPELFDALRRAFRNVLVVLAVGTPLMTAGMYQRVGVTPLVAVALALTLVVWHACWQYRRGHFRLAVHSTLLAVFVTSIVMIADYGSLRSSGVHIMLASIVAAGTFLPRKWLFFTVLIGCTSLVVLGLLEEAGRLPTPDFRTSWTVWGVQILALVCLLLSLFSGRNRLTALVRDQTATLRETQQARAAALANQARFEALFRSNPSACLVQSLTSRHVVDVNDAYCELFGYRREDLLGRRPSGTWAHGADRLAFLHQLSQEGRVQGMRATGRRRDGSEFPCVVHAEQVLQNDEPMLIATVLDVSAEHRSSLALEKSRDRFSKTFNRSPICMTLTRLSDGRYLEVNAACEGVMGGNPADYIGKTSMEAGVWPSEAVRNDFANTLRRDGRLLAYETQVLNRQGEAIDVMVWAEIIEVDGEECALTFVFNVAEEKRRREMLLNLARGVSSKTGEAFFLSLAEQIATAVGANSVVIGEIQGDHALDTLGLLHNGQLQPGIVVNLQQTTYAELMHADEIAVIDVAGTAQGLHTPPVALNQTHTVAGLVLRDPDGSAIGVLAVVWEDTHVVSPDTRALMAIFASRCNAELVRLRRDREIRQLQATLEQRVQARTAQLQYVNRELDAFAYSVSHDLKSPLRSMDGFMHLLHEQMADRLDDADRDLFRRASASVARMTSLITDLLSLARVSQGRLLRQRVDLSQMARSIMEAYPEDDSDHLTEVAISPGLTAYCDPQLARIVLENLLGNAWKYSRQQASPRIEFGRTAAPAGESPAFFVRDNGAGFDMTRVDRLFQPFTRLHSANEFEGSGIGLATVRRIIERHGGSIKGEGAVGLGATFSFHFGSGNAD